MKLFKQAKNDELTALKESNSDKLSELKKYNQKALKELQASIKEQKKALESGIDETASEVEVTSEMYARAAELSDMAIRDMADNANKMGTNINSIMFAYMGLAKGNATMLDNLKVGYGGTQTEMLRLAKDMGVVDESVKSFGDISFDKAIEAIHKLQEKLEITGTSAEEAAGTIQGSAGSIKAAWSNLVTALADPNADLTTYIDNFVQSAITMGENMIPAFERALEGVGRFIEGMATAIAEKLPEIIQNDLPKFIQSGVSAIMALIQGMANAVPEIVKAVKDLIPVITKTVTENLPLIISAGMELLIGLTEGIVDALPELIPAIVECIATITDALTDPDMLTKIWQAALDLVLTLVEGIVENVDELIDAAFQVIGNLVDFILRPENIEKLIECMFKVQIALAEGLIKAIPVVLKGATELVWRMWETYQNGNWHDLGWNIIQGVWDGLKKAWNDLTRWWGDAWNGLIDGAKNMLGIHSPSRVFAQIGGYMAEGLGDGWQDEFSDVKDNIENGLDFNAGDVSINGKNAYNNGISGVNAGSNNFYFYFNFDNISGNKEDMEENAELFMNIFAEKMSRRERVFG